MLKDEGAPIGWNPYVVSARLMALRIESDKSLNELADQIAQKIAERSADLISRNPVPPIAKAIQAPGARKISSSQPQDS